jgi:hypothetical protein
VDGDQAGEVDDAAAVDANEQAGVESLFKTRQSLS